MLSGILQSYNNIFSNISTVSNIIICTCKLTSSAVNNLEPEIIRWPSKYKAELKLSCVLIHLVRHRKIRAKLLKRSNWGKWFKAIGAITLYRIVRHVFVFRNTASFASVKLFY